MAADPDRRHDKRTREVLDSIETDWRTAIAHVRDEYARLARLIRRVIAVLIASVLVLAAIVALAFVLQDRDRRGAVVSACEARNDQSTASIRFIGLVAPELAPLARREFPREPDCEAYADRLGY